MSRKEALPDPVTARLRPFLLPLNIFVLLLCVAGVWQCVLKPGLSVRLTPTKEGFWVERGGQEMLQGDLIRSVDEIHTNDRNVLELQLDGHRIGDQVTVEVGREGKVRRVQAVLVPYYSLFYLVVITLVGLLFFALGLVVAVKLPGSDPALVFHLTMNCVAVMIMGTSGAYQLSVPLLGVVVRIVFVTAYAFMPPLFLHFTLLFPTTKLGWEKGIRIFYAVALVMALAGATIFVGTVASDSFLIWGELWSGLFNLCRGIFALGCLLSILSFVQSYRIARDEISRRKLRWLLLGAVAGLLPFILLWLGPLFIGSRPIVPEEGVILAAGITPVTFAIAIVRHRLMDIDLILKRSTVYAVMVALLLGVYLSIVAGVAGLIGSLTVEESLIASIASAVIVALLFDPVRQRVQEFVDRKFFRVGYNYRQVQRTFADEINRMVEAEAVARHVIARVDQLIPVERIGLFVLDESARRVHSLAQRGFDLLNNRSLPFDMEGLQWDLDLPLVLEEHLEPGVAAARPDRLVFARWGLAAVFLTLSEGGIALGFLAVGPRRSGGRFTMEDIDLLGSIAAQTGLAIERLNLQRRLVLERAESERLSELNRMKSYFVSTVTHELKTPLTSIQILAELLGRPSELSPQRKKEYLDSIEEQIERLARLIDNVLDFAKVEQGVRKYRFAPTRLNDVVELTAALFARQIEQRGFVRQFRLDPLLPVLSLDEDAVEQALINLIANAIKYSADERFIGISTFLQDQYVGVAVEDRGIGIAPENLLSIFDLFYRVPDVGGAKIAGTGLGLALVREIMQAHNGLIETESHPGRGTTIRLLFPHGQIAQQQMS